VEVETSRCDVSDGAARRPYHQFFGMREPSIQPKPKRIGVEGFYHMNNLSVIIAGFVLVFATVSSRAANVDRISAETGIPVATLQAERASTGLGWGSLENAHLLANASGQSFDSIVALHQSGEGWGKIAHDNGLNLGRLVSNAHRSSQATMHAQNTNAVHGKSTTAHGKSTTTVRGRSTTNIARGHTSRMTTKRGIDHSSSFRSSGFHGMHSMGHISGSRGMGSMGHGGGRGH
jgi:hypothetical protein